jgi:hypothetical protein
MTAVLAFDGQKVRPLWRHYPRWSVISRLFRSEGRPLGEADPVRMAELFVLLSSRSRELENEWRVLIRSVPQGTWGDDLGPAPTLSGDGVSGWTLRFATTQSMTSRFRDARWNEVWFSPKFDVRYRERRLGTWAEAMSAAMFDQHWRQLFPSGGEPP